MAEGKKGLPTWAWFGIGCAGLLALVLVVVIALGVFAVKKVKDVAGDLSGSSPEMTAARMIVKMHPDIEEVSEDTEAGTITIREKKSGKEITVNLQELKEGKFSFDTEEGHVEISAEEGEGQGGLKISSEKGTMIVGQGAEGAYPEWLPIPDGMIAKGQYMADDEGARKGAVKLDGDFDAKAIQDFYEKTLKDEGFEVQKNSFSHDKQSMTVLQGVNADQGHSLTVTIVQAEDGLTATLAYQEESR